MKPRPYRWQITRAEPGRWAVIPPRHLRACCCWTITQERYGSGRLAATMCREFIARLEHHDEHPTCPYGGTFPAARARAAVECGTGFPFDGIDARGVMIETPPTRLPIEALETLPQRLPTVRRDQFSFQRLMREKRGMRA